MRSYPINFLYPVKQPLQAWTLPGLMFMALSVALCFTVFNQHQIYQEKRSELDEQVAGLNRQFGSAKSSSQPQSKGTMPIYSAEEIRQIQEIRQSYSIPWTDIFSALEIASSEKLALLSVTPNVSKRTLELTGEARNLADTSSFIKLLQQQRIFRKVYLQEHVYDEQDISAPLLFVIQAEWSGYE